MTKPCRILKCTSAIAIAVALLTAPPALAARGTKKGPPPPSGPIATVLEVNPPQNTVLVEPGITCGWQFCWPWFGGGTLLSARLTTHDGRGVEGRSVRLSTQDPPDGNVDRLVCSGVTDASGYARCDVEYHWGVSTMARADFDGDADHLPSSDRWSLVEDGAQ